MVCERTPYFCSSNVCCIKNGLNSPEFYSPISPAVYPSFGTENQAYHYAGSYRYINNSNGLGQNYEKVLKEAVQRAKANDKERRRTKDLKDAFSSLRSIIPTLPNDKMTKMQTLKLALRYIDFLNEVLKGEDNNKKIEDCGCNIEYAFANWRLKKYALSD